MCTLNEQNSESSEIAYKLDIMDRTSRKSYPSEDSALRLYSELSGWECEANVVVRCLLVSVFLTVCQRLLMALSRPLMETHGHVQES